MDFMKQTASEARFVRSEGLVFRQIAGEGILVPVSAHIADLRSIFRMNATATAVWRRLDGQTSVGEIVDQIVSEFDAMESDVTADVEQFLAQIEAEGLARLAPSECQESAA